MLYWWVIYYNKRVFLCCNFSIQVKVFVQGLFHLDKDIPQFKEHLRDFLVQIKVKLHYVRMYVHVRRRK